jgi:hypothetical protein
MPYMELDFAEGHDDGQGEEAEPIDGGVADGYVSDDGDDVVSSEGSEEREYRGYDYLEVDDAPDDEDAFGAIADIVEEYFDDVDAPHVEVQEDGDGGLCHLGDQDQDPAPIDDVEMGYGSGVNDTEEQALMRKSLPGTYLMYCVVIMCSISYNWSSRVHAIDVSHVYRC